MERFKECIIQKMRIQPVCRSKRTYWEHSRRSWSCQTPIKQRCLAGPTESTKQDTKVCHDSVAVSFGHSVNKYPITQTTSRSARSQVTQRLSDPNTCFATTIIVPCEHNIYYELFPDQFNRSITPRTQLEKKP